MFGFFQEKDRSFKNKIIDKLLKDSDDFNSLDQIYKKSQLYLNSLYIDDEPALITCCRRNLLNSVLWLLENKIDIEITNSLNETALFYAIYSNDNLILDALLKKGINFNHLNNNKRTALQESVFNSNIRVSRYLLKKTELIKNSDLKGNNVLFDAIHIGNLVLIEEILKLEKIDLEYKNKDANTILHLKNSLEKYPIASLLIDYGANPLLNNKSGENFLFFLVTKGEAAYKLIKKIEEKGHSLDSKNSFGKNILMFACEYFLKLKDKKKLDSQRKLIKRLFQTDINKESLNKNSESIIFEIAKTSDKELIDFAILNLPKQNLNKQNSFGFTPLFYLVLGGFSTLDSIDLLNINGAKIDYRNRDNINLLEFLINIILHIENKTTIHEDLLGLISKNRRYKELLEELIKKYKLDVNELNSKNEPLFFSSLLNFNFSIFRILISFNLDINKKDKNGDNILFRLIKQDIIKNSTNQEKLIKTIKNLIKIGLNIDEKDKDGYTALSYSIIHQKDEFIKLFVELNASFDILDNQGRTLIHTAVLQDKVKYIKFLRKNSDNLINQVDNFGVSALNYALFMGKAELALKLISLNANLENPHPKSIKILEFLKKFHKNILAISSLSKDTKEKIALHNLAQNMIVEFNIDISRK